MSHLDFKDGGKAHVPVELLLDEARVDPDGKNADSFRPDDCEEVFPHMDLIDPHAELEIAHEGVLFL